jgi:hypothetical protein
MKDGVRDTRTVFWKGVGVGGGGILHFIVLKDVKLKEI